MRWLITGTAGFIGFHVAKRLLQEGHEVTGVDGMTPYYDVKLKESRHAQLEKFSGFRAHCCMLEDADKLKAAIEKSEPDVVIHLAAQAGVRHSLEHPRAYIDSNIIGTFNILEMCRQLRPKHLLIASTSSVYGPSKNMPFAESESTDHPLTLYSASKKSVETIAHCYAHVWKQPITIFRFFSVYGPWGRPDMALFKFVQNILADKPIDIYNHGKMSRDFTYIDDLAESIIRLSAQIPAGDNGAGAGDVDTLSPIAPYRIVNIGGGHPVNLMEFIEEVERVLERPAKRNYLGMQLGDVERSEASPRLLQALTGFSPSTPVSVGVGEFIRWYREYYRA